MNIYRNSIRPRSLSFWLLAVYLTFVFLVGGSSRTDAQSLAILCPISVLACGFALATVRREHLNGSGWLLGLLALSALLLLAQVFQLPSWIWGILPGRGLILEIDKGAELLDLWRPLTLTPINGWQSVVALCVPVTVFLTGVQLAKTDLYYVTYVILALGLISAILGLLQVIGGPTSSFYLYNKTSNGFAVGLYANRNHAAAQIAFLFPMLAVFVLSAGQNRDQKNRNWIFAIFTAILLVLMVLITGSRTGTFLAVIGFVGAGRLLSTAWGRRTSPVKQQLTQERFIIAGTAVIALFIAGLAVFLSRAEAIDRFVSQSNINDIRLVYWSISLQHFWGYFPIGAGVGSFSEAFLVGEPTNLLGNTYLNRVHNDWLETAVTLGFPGTVLLFIAVIVYFKRIIAAWHADGGVGQMAGLVIGMLAIASITDYPLRTSSMMCTLVVASLWLNLAITSKPSRPCSKI